MFARLWIFLFIIIFVRTFVNFNFGMRGLSCMKERGFYLPFKILFYD